MDSILQILEQAIYPAMGLVAVYGIFCVVLIVRRIAQKQFVTTAAGEQFRSEVREHLAQGNFQAVADLCDSPPNWSKAVPQLILVAMQNLEYSPAKLRRLLAEKFERDVLADLEYRTSWVATVVKVSPMLGLLGTVVGMINAFGKIAVAKSSGIAPEQLAGDISFALFTTALGLAIAIPFVLAGNMLHVRIGKLQDLAQQELSGFLDDLDAALAAQRRTAG